MVMINGKWDKLLLLAEAAELVWETEIAPKSIPIEKRNFQMPIHRLSDDQNPTKIPRIVFTLEKSDDLTHKKPATFPGWVTGKRSARTLKLPTSPPTILSHVPSCSSSSQAVSTTTEKKKSKRVPQSPFPVGDGERALALSLRDRIVAEGGREIVRVLEKRLYATDVFKGNNRLSIPFNKLQVSPNTFIRDGELAMAEDINTGLTVAVFDERFREFELVLKTWKMGCNVVYNLISKWNSVVRENDFSENDPVQLWAFRRSDNGLAFLVVKIQEDEQ